MRLAMFALALSATVGALWLPAQAGYSDYYVKQLKSATYDPPNTPYQITVSGPFAVLSDCQYEARADAREDNFHHIFTCSMGR